uniref:Reverse transcriptase domain-containing protein n=1 Tax=Leptobrachium leishanense TaxID=445787 RepID=A0A8C5MSB1_9ANUR
MRRLLDSHQLVDVWRALHGGEKDYSYYSSVHAVYSRIDYFFVQQHTFDIIRASDIHTKTWSDHSPISACLTSPIFVPRERTWRLNLSLLEDPVVLAETRQLLSDYFVENLTPEIPITTVWEAHKAVLRGFLISKGTAAKKLRIAQKADLFDEVSRLENLHAASGDTATYQLLIKARASLTSRLTADLKFLATKTNSFFALHENKPGRLLAQILKSKKAKAYIPRIRLPSKDITTHPDRVAEEFYTYFQSLYSLQTSQFPDLNVTDINSYLANKNLKRLSPEEATDLGSSITVEELVSALKHVKPHKCPGPDGLPVEYLKLLQPELLPHLLATFNSLLSEGTLHSSALAATITLIPKPGKDPLLPSSYRPISLLNTDVKLLARILASRLQQYLPRLVDSDQVGFIPGREAKDATSRVINAILIAKQEKLPFLLLSTDAEKAFDRVLWPYLMQVLQQFGLGDGFLRWVSALYTSPSARVRVNGALTASFPILNGTRQGCPLSPLLFALSLEPLLAAIRANPVIPGLQGRRHRHKVAAYADDLMFLLTDPITSLPEVVRELQHYGTVAGLTINAEKSEILGISVPEGMAQQLQKRFRFKWCADKLKYLGIWLSADVMRISKLNFEPLLIDIRHDIKTWSNKHISWLGRIGVLKMNILPRILYLMQTIPLPISNEIFQALRLCFLSFVWVGARPRLKFTTLCRPTTQGGLALPDIRLYYHATHLTRILDWMVVSPTKKWLDLEASLASSPLWVLPWLFPDHIPTTYRSIPTLICTINIWHKLRDRHSLSTFPAPLLPLSHNPAFRGGIRPTLRNRFTTHPGLLAMHVLKDGQFRQIPTSDVDPPLTYLDRFNFLQIKHFLLSLPNSTNLTRPLTTFEGLCAKGTVPSHSLSSQYHALQSSDLDPPSYVGRWDTMLGTVIPEMHWTKTFTLIHHGTPLSRLKETSFKIASLWYTTPIWIARFSPTHSTECWRCLRDQGTFLHLWWTCPNLEPFWRSASSLIEHTTEIVLDFTPEIFLLGQMKLSVKSLKKSVLIRILLAARALIPIHWNSSVVPSPRDLISKVENIRSLETANLPPGGWTEVHNTTWFHWNSFISSADCRRWLQPD